MREPAAKQTLRVALVNSHGLFLSALARLVESCDEMEVVVETTDGSGLIEAMRDTPVDVVAIDAVIPGGNGFETIRELAQARRDVRLLVLSMHANAAYVSRAREAGAHGFVANDADASQFVDAIRLVAQSGRFIVVPADFEPTGARHPGPHPTATSAVTLTSRQRSVLELIIAGLRTADIAQRLGINVKTVENHRANLMRRMGVRNTAELVREALYLELVPLAP